MKNKKMMMMMMVMMVRLVIDVFVKKKEKNVGFHCERQMWIHYECDYGDEMMLLEQQKLVVREREG